MKILVLGGTRYFGKRLVDLLLNEGHQVTVASTGKTGAQYSQPVERITIERKSSDSMRTALAHRTWDLVYDQICFNAEEARIACHALSGKIGSLVYTSSQSVYDYGVNIEEGAFKTSGYIENSLNKNSYQEGKRMAEQVYAAQEAFPVVAVRFPVVMGPDDHTRRLHWHIARVIFGHPIFFPNPEGNLTVISSVDAARFLQWIAVHQQSGPVNACSPDPLCLENLIELIVQATGKKLIQGSPEAPDETSSFGVVKDWCASADKACAMGFGFSKSASWLPSLIFVEKDRIVLEDAKVHRLGF